MHTLSALNEKIPCIRSSPKVFPPCSYFESDGMGLAWGQTDEHIRISRVIDAITFRFRFYLEIGRYTRTP